MTVKIVTDSTADLPLWMANEMGITVVPAYVRFGDQIYRDRVDISEDEFYQRLVSDPIHPTTEPPTPQDFAGAYKKLAQEADGIISIHVSSKLSATCNSAIQGTKLADTECPIEVVDSELLTMGLGLLVTAANTLAGSGKGSQQVADEVRQIIPNIHMLGLLDTVKYLALGGRIGWAKALLGSMLAVKPMLAMKDGELEQAGRVRSRAKGIDGLFHFMKNARDIQDLAIVYSTTHDETQALAGRIGPIFPEERIRLTRLGPAMGVHAGPGALFVALRAKA